MSINLRLLVEFYETFDRYLRKEAAPGLLEKFPIDISPEKGLLKLYQAYSGCDFELKKLDFTDGLAERIQEQSAANASINNYIQPAELGSLILNFGDHAEIYINDASSIGDKKILNDCYRRFLIMKEVFHVILRDEFLRHELEHPDTNRPELLVSLLEELVYLPFSLVDFDNPDYTDAIKVEHAAELFAALSLYPIEHISADRAAFIANINADSMQDPVVITSSTLPYAEIYKLPRRYVDLLFRWKRFSELEAYYRQISHGYVA